MYWYVYRKEGGATTSTTNKSIDQLAQEVLAGIHGNGDTRKASLGNKYDSVMAKVNELVKGKQSPAKSVDELAKEVLAGKHGNGEARKKSLGSRYDEVQKAVDKLLKGGTSSAPKVEQPKTEPKPAVVIPKKEEGDLVLNEAILKKATIDKILELCKKHDILPSYAITVLHFEGLWGTSAVGKKDNNWGGMTMTSDDETITRPSGILVTRGLARPANEGGYYMHYASVDDFLTDWFYLLRKDGSYKVSGAKTFSEAIKGMFKVGGAKYDYAAVGYEDYLVGMSSRLKSIEAENGNLTKYDATRNNVTSAKPDKIDIVLDGIEVTINGVSYTLTKKPV